MRGRTLALGSIALLAYRYFKGKKAEDEPMSATRSRRSTKSRSASRSRSKSR
jgi:hypothetical protein